MSAIAGIGLHLVTSGQLAANIRLWSAGSGLTSAADQKCKQLWVTNARNDPALECYLTTETARLCRSEERVHLANLLYRYRKESLYLAANVTVGVFAPRVLPLGGPDELEAVQARLEAIEKGQADDRRQLEAIQRAGAERAALIERFTADSLDAALGVAQLPDEWIIADIRSLAESGLMRKKDFGWFAGELVTAAFQNLKPGEPVCEGAGS